MFEVQWLGSLAWGLVGRVQGGVHGLEFGVWGEGFRVWGLGFGDVGLTLMPSP